MVETVAIQVHANVRGYRSWVLGDTGFSAASAYCFLIGTVRVSIFVLKENDLLVHDTSDASPMRMPCSLDDNRFFRPDGGNLAAFLYMLQVKHPDHFRNIEDTVRQVAPFFDRFNLAPSRLNPEKIRLEWNEKGTDAYFNETALSDGSLRFICLATLLLQPQLPAMVLLDEPELGLHPAAIALLADLLTSAATRTQLLVATQSVTLVNHLEPEHIWTAERRDGETVFKHLERAELTTWLESYEGAEGYGLGDLWEKNVLGARP